MPKKYIDKINVSVRNGIGKVVTIGSTANIMLDLTQAARAAAAAGDVTQWAIVITVPEYNNPTGDKYVVQKANRDTDDQSPTYNEWIGDEVDIDIERCLGYEGYDDEAEDIRNWAPWYLVDSIVKIVEHFDEDEFGASTEESIWFLDMPVMYGGGEDISSMRFSEDDGITQCVWA
jgi:hypothetical protein